jgi:hypothetical protein
MELRKKADGLLKSIRELMASQAGFAIGGVVSMLFLGFIAIMLVLQFVPMFETDILTTGITNTFVKTLVEMCIWVLPSVAIIAIIVKVVKKIKG